MAVVSERRRGARVKAGRGFVVACAAAIILVALASACGDDDSAAAATGTGATAAPTEEATHATATVAETATRAAVQPTATTTTGGGGGQVVDNTPLLPCNNILVPLDKDHRLAQDCVPSGLVSLPGGISYGGQQLMTGPAAAALETMLAAAATDGLQIFATSSYRSFDQQVVTFQQNVASGGLAYAERTSAHAGHSEHQLGTTTDLTSASNGYGLEGFETTPEGKWIASNSWRYGFIVSYPPGKEAITGYAYEAWHVRWLGTDVAGKVQASGLTLHEYLLKQ